jgi:hypothetical protein
MVQVLAVDRLIELDALRAGIDGTLSSADPFSRERRLEQRQPDLLPDLPAVMPGYSRTPEAALAILEALQRRTAALDASITARILELANPRAPE